MNFFLQILLAVVFGAFWFILGWISRSVLFTKEKDCANPAHQDWDYRKERQ